MTHFEDAEFLCGCRRPECPAPKGPHRLLRFYLDRARAMYGGPIVVTSGNRCPEWNQHEHGEDPSEHVFPEGCLGCDLRCHTSTERWRLLDALRLAGLTRIGLYSKHLHVGVGDIVQPTTFPGYVTWLGSYTA